MSQTEMILAHLKAGMSITPLEALREYGCFRLGARIWDLKRDGHLIATETEYDRKSKKHYARYRIVRKEERAA